MFAPDLPAPTRFGSIVLHSPALCAVEVLGRRAWHHAQAHRDDERGEGVVSVAIAVLIMAFLGAIMYVAFSGTMKTAQSKTNCNVSTLSTDPTGAGAGC